MVGGVVVGGMVVRRKRGRRRATEGGGLPGAFRVLGWVAGEADWGVLVGIHTYMCVRG